MITIPRDLIEFFVFCMTRENIERGVNDIIAILRHSNDPYHRRQVCQHSHRFDFIVSFARLVARNEVRHKGECFLTRNQVGSAYDDNDD